MGKSLSRQGAQAFMIPAKPLAPTQFWDQFRVRQNEQQQVGPGQKAPVGIVAPGVEQLHEEDAR